MNLLLNSITYDIIYLVHMHMPNSQTTHIHTRICPRQNIRSGTTTIHRPHGAGTIVIRPSVTHRPYAYHRPSLPLATQQPLPLPLYTPPPQSQPQRPHQHFVPAAPQPAIESMLLGSREPPTGISVLDNTIASDLDTAASISTGMLHTYSV